MFHTVLVTVALAAAPAWERDADALRRMLETLRQHGPDSPYGGPLFPADLRVDDVQPQAHHLVARVSGHWNVPERQLEVTDELRRETLLGAAHAHGLSTGFVVMVRGDDGIYRALGMRGQPVGRAPSEDPRPTQGPLPVGTPVPKSARFPFGAPLLGRRIALSAGHGWLENGGGWATQRSRWAFEGCANCRGITEDFFTAEVMTTYVIPLLENMGAQVILVREPDHSLPDGVLLDDGDVAYSEVGSWGQGANAGGFLDDYRTNADTDQGYAQYQVDVGAPGPRRVSMRYLQGSNRTTSAVVTIAHAGGQQVFNLDQTLMGQHWLDLGSYWFEPGAGLISLSHGVAEGYLIADAVKVGGGVFATSGKPFWEMGAESYVPWAGASTDVTSRGDVTIRPAYAEYLGPDLYISIHANASGVEGGSSANGISTYRYSCMIYGDHGSSDSAQDCDDPPGSKLLIDTVHAAIVERLHADWDPNYGDRGKRVANFGEVRELIDAPGILIETGFFDNIVAPTGAGAPRYADNRSLHDPRWREAFAYGLTEGIAAYLAPGSGAPPVRPGGLRALNKPDGTLVVAWNGVANADAYRLYVASTERAWDAGQIVTGTQTTVTGLQPGAVYAFRVAALGNNGEGLPSQAVAARFRGAVLNNGNAGNALFINAYDRRDAWVQDRDNDFSYAVEHGHALGAVSGRDIYFDGALDEVVEDATVPLGGYALVDYAAGKDSTRDVSVSKTMQGILAGYVDGGGALLISGEEIGYHLAETSVDPEDQAFLEEVLGAVYVADDAETFQLDGVGGGPFADLSDIAFDDGTGGVYEVVYPDVFSAAAGASVVLLYPDATGAAVARERVIFVGTPLETIVPASARREVFQRAVAYLVPTGPYQDADLDGASDECEATYGLNPLNFEDGAQDDDNDGRSNAVECQEGTHPRDGAVVDAGVTTDAAVVVTPDAGSRDATVAQDAASPPRADAATGTTDAATTTPDAGEDRDAGTSGGRDARFVTRPPEGEEPPAIDEPAGSSGCGCATGEPNDAMMLVALVAMWRRRRVPAAPMGVRTA
ncbi:MAG: N-acetylmuramoyl-L-alanine amidase [Myxococcota bacterium]